MRRSLHGLTLLAALGCRSLLAAPPDAEIRKLLVQRIDDERQGVGIVVGILDANGRRIVAHGVTDATSKRRVDGDTIFEIGSISKVFTSLLLADAVVRGEVALTDPVSKFLPPYVKMPERGGKQITLQDLANHSSGLPRLPDNLTPSDESDPYADYDAARLHAFLSRFELQRDTGEQYEYSNLGAGLLGYVLARRAGVDYATLVETRITRPLGMKSTSVRVPERARGRLAHGHDQELKPVASWNFSALAGAGALRSTANDLLTFIAAAMGRTRTSLQPAMTSMLVQRWQAGAGNSIALGWHIGQTAAGEEVIWHNGGTGGYRSYLGYHPKSGTAVVALSNMSTPTGVDDLGRYLLDPSTPLRTMPKAVPVKTEVYAQLTGHYELAPNFVLTITQEEGRLFLQATGQPRFELFAESERRFFLRAVDARVTFAEPVDGVAPSLTLHQNGLDIPGKRLTSAPAPAKQRTPIELSETTLARYVGRYQLAPSFAITVTRDGKSLFAQATGQARYPIFAETERQFFYKVVDAQLTFTIDPTGVVTGLVLHQNGMDQPAAKVE